MADQHEIDGWRKAYENYSRDQLIAVMHSKVEYCAEHIAAKQRLNELLESEEYGRRIIDIARDSNYAFWNALLTLNAIIISVFSAVAVFSPRNKALVLIIVAISMVAALLLILNFRSVRNKYRLIGQTLHHGVQNLTADQRNQQLNNANRGHKWCNYRETVTHLVLFVQAILILVLVWLKS